MTDYKTELERAYRALRAIYGKVAIGLPLNDDMLRYHSMTLGAAMRFREDDKLDGADYFLGKDVSVLESYLRRYGPGDPKLPLPVVGPDETQH